MKEKGFTLVELLAVIVVLAIVSLIAVPTVLNIISRVRLNALKDSAYGLVEAGTLYNAQYENTKNIRFEIEDTKVSSNDTENLLEFKGKVKEGTVIVNRQGKTTVCISDGTNSAYKNYNETKVTLLKKKKCTIPENTYIVYLDDEKTISEYTPAELTDIVDEMQSKITSLEEQLNSKSSKEELNSVSSIVNSKASLKDVYPVGSIYITTTNTNPETYISGTTWASFGTGKTLVGVNSSDDDFNSVEKTNGSKTISYTPEGTIEGTKLTVSQIPSHSHVIPALSGSAASSGSAHTHTFSAGGYSINVQTTASHSVMTSNKGFQNLASGGWWSGMNKNISSIASSGTHSHSVTTTANATTTCTNCNGEEHTHEFSGASANISTLQPYITVYMWKRTA